ncbi:MAG TPA: hypothetical protein P5531_14545 [Bacteroidales bacterium]|nr:hypothetical protein [Bacteroidales bacterium]HSA44807.1 hypothetical protein [Bacteroidales bacterium]
MIKLFLPLLLLSGIVQAQTGSIGGTVRYINGLPLDDSTVVMIWQPGMPVIMNTVVSGNYLFTNLAPGSYEMQAVCWKDWGGCNANDCLFIMREYVKIPPLLTGLALQAADVNNSGGTPNCLDALAIARRFVYQIPNFLPPNIGPYPGNQDWISEKFQVVIVPGSTLTQHIKMICTGDVSGNYFPP